MPPKEGAAFISPALSPTNGPGQPNRACLCWWRADGEQGFLKSHPQPTQIQTHTCSAATAGPSALGSLYQSTLSGRSSPQLTLASMLQSHLRPPPDMSCYSPCQTVACGPAPLANSCNEPCVLRCADSSVAIQPPPVVVTLPGPILSSFPQSTAVGSTASAAVGSSLSAGSVPVGARGSLGLGGFGWSGLGRGLCGTL